MKNKGFLIIGIFGAIEIIYFLIHQPSSETILGFEINGWFYLIIWILVVAISLYQFFIKNKK